MATRVARRCGGRNIISIGRDATSWNREHHGRSIQRDPSKQRGKLGGTIDTDGPGSFAFESQFSVFENVTVLCLAAGMDC